jgi:hypothetical protein
VWRFAHADEPTRSAGVTGRGCGFVGFRRVLRGRVSCCCTPLCYSFPDRWCVAVDARLWRIFGCPRARYTAPALTASEIAATLGVAFFDQTMRRRSMSQGVPGTSAAKTTSGTSRTSLVALSAVHSLMSVLCPWGRYRQS